MRKAGVATLVVLALAVGACGYGYWWLHDLGSPPDVAAAARSAEVDRAARLAVEPVDTRLRAAVATATWAQPVGVAVEDVCRTEHGPFFGQGYQPVTCTRTTTAILAADRRRQVELPEVQTVWVDPADDPLLRRELVAPTDSATEVYRARKQFDADAVRAAQARRASLLIVSASLQYYDGSAEPTPPPGPRGGCRDTDSARCPGG